MCLGLVYYKTLKEDYKNYLGAELGVIHMSQLLNDLINDKNINFENKISPDLDFLVTYHDLLII